MEKLYTIKETAKNLGVSVETIRNYIKRGELKVIKFTSNNFKVKESEIKRFIDSRES